MKRGKHQVSGLSGLQCDLGRFGIANLADHNDVRVLPQDRAEAVGKRQSCLGVDLDLINVFDFVLDGIFNGNDVDGR